MNIRTTLLTLALMTPAAIAFAGLVCDSPALSYEDDGTWIDVSDAVEGLRATGDPDHNELADSFDSCSDGGWLHIQGWAAASHLDGADKPAVQVAEATEGMIQAGDALTKKSDGLQQELDVLVASMIALRPELLKVAQAMVRSHGTPEYKGVRAKYMALLRQRQGIYSQYRSIMRLQIDVRNAAMSVYMGVADVASIQCVLEN